MKRRLAQNTIAILLTIACCCAFDTSAYAASGKRLPLEEAIAAARKTPAPEDDLLLASKMLRNAMQTFDDKRLVYYCDNIVLLSSASSKGLPTAVRAMELLADRIPEKRQASLEKACALQLKQFEAGANLATGGEFVRLLIKFSKSLILNGDGASADKVLKRAQAIATNLKSKSLGDRVKSEIESLPNHAAISCCALIRTMASKATIWKGYSNALHRTRITTTSTRRRSPSSMRPAPASANGSTKMCPTAHCCLRRCSFTAPRPFLIPAVSSGEASSDGPGLTEISIPWKILPSCVATP